jgi:recombination protein RecA
VGHGRQAVDYLDWKASLLGNIPQLATRQREGRCFVDFTPLPELGELQQVVYLGDGKKHLTGTTSRR